ncbi:3-hydroxyacyl-ACP dehydratase Htd2 [Schizosaccharomyces cryophilus OY26]|uniref:3-hydroxyacyl-ACP dehydratase Htd2 n=1 Tax=Schizosaccharomyces cryophilus (strain OY26 / ATCC MYA-4695 / CBS 11777 / NBRC 106824 / NRRL Y48691) TaxID=653667 RepID=S9W794_SCHCR|nr:3-hydroxyacyl-ACP dehydratase Htd2 [Schizosaccharomyces cryophilus OY26]EPY53770.1 3-hydroxyacyl-ACP dehydratase Htd2 [Schizosaccharomyces cryophilus OY26]
MASRKIVLKEFLSPSSIHKLQALFQGKLPEPKSSSGLQSQSFVELAQHFVYLNSASSETNLDSDGYETIYAPYGKPLRYKHRLWLHGVLKFHAPLRLFQEAECHEIVHTKPISQKKRQVSMAEDYDPTLNPLPTQVLVERKIYDQQQNLCLEEDRTLYYTNKDYLTDENRITSKYPSKKSWSFTPTEIMVFRYSSLMFNAHFIHWNRPYTTSVEKYPNLIIPGPLLITAMANFFRFSYPELSKRVRQFDYRLLAPAFVGTPIRVCTNDTASVWLESESTKNYPTLLAKGRFSFVSA